MVHVKIIRIVVASPGDVSDERTVLQTVTDELNDGITRTKNIRLELTKWETDSYPGFHPEGPQGHIDPLLNIANSDIFIGIFWKRFGTPVSDAGSGTEHEFRHAYEAWKKNGSPHIMFYFNRQPVNLTSKNEAEQLRRVMEFKESFPKEGLWWSYNGVDEFERLVRNHLTKWILNYNSEKIDDSDKKDSEPVKFVNVCYLPKQYRFYHYRDYEEGTLLVYRNSAEFRSEKSNIKITDVSDVSHTSQGGDLANNWVRVEFGDKEAPAEAFFCEKSFLGSLRGGSKEIFSALHKLVE